MSNTFSLGATAAFGLEGVVANELKRLGYEAKGFLGGAAFSGTLLDAFRANLWLRTADRVLLYAARFRAETFDDLFEGVRAAAWEDILPKDAEVYVTGKCARSRLMSVPDVQSISKKAIVERLKTALSQSLPEDGARYHIDVHIHENEVAVTLDTSGAGLARRGLPHAQRRRAPAGDARRGHAARLALADRPAVLRPALRLRHAAHRGGHDRAGPRAGPEPPL